MLLLIPTTLAASCAFMLPVSTPANAIVYGTGKGTNNEDGHSWHMVGYTICVLTNVFCIHAWSFNL
ncbi:MAG: hypothetical protein Ct9H90mP25_6270 [Gammaproteobacteria bacterium]|nr:MAG: hypothetical protein Ct9H90mP25_6270 [Gammaproteobacteria bacterium]